MKKRPGLAHIKKEFMSKNEMHQLRSTSKERIMSLRRFKLEVLELKASTVTTRLPTTTSKEHFDTAILLTVSLY